MHGKDIIKCEIFEWKISFYLHRKPIYYILNMKQLKLHEDGLDKQQNNFETNKLIPNNVILNKRKNDAKNKEFDNDHNKIEDKES